MDSKSSNVRFIGWLKGTVCSFSLGEFARFDG